MKPAITPCRACGILIVRVQHNRKFCKPCQVSRLREQKRIWQRKWRDREKLQKTKAILGQKSVDVQRQRAAFSEDYEEVLSGGG